MRLIMFVFVTLSLSRAVNADAIRLMSDGETGVAQIHQYLSQAHATIDISTFIWEPCSTVARLITSDLKAAVGRGVRARVLIDAWTQSPEMRANLSAYLTGLGVEVRYFNVRRDYDPMNNRRMHAKIIVVDQAKYYLGGRNIADDYFDMGTNNWMDRDVAVEGASALHAADQFAMLWNDAMTTRVSAPRAANFGTWASKCFASESRDRLLTKVLAARTNAVLTPASAHQCANVRVFTDEPGFADLPGQAYLPTAPLTTPMYARKHTTRAVVDFIAAAHGDLTIENYTYVPEALVDEALTYQRDRGLPIRVYTNAQMDTGPIHYLKEESIKKDRVGSQSFIELSHRGSIQFPWAMTPRRGDVHWNLHTKAMVSANDSLVGSFNIDPRSYGANLESTVVVRGCPSLAADLRGSMRRLDAFFERDRSCAKCHVKEESSLADQIRATIGRRLYFRRPDHG